MTENELWHDVNVYDGKSNVQTVTIFTYDICELGVLLCCKILAYYCVRVRECMSVMCAYKPADRRKRENKSIHHTLH